MMIVIEILFFFKVIIIIIVIIELDQLNIIILSKDALFTGWFYRSWIRELWYCEENMIMSSCLTDDSLYLKVEFDMSAFSFRY